MLVRPEVEEDIKTVKRIKQKRVHIAKLQSMESSILFVFYHISWEKKPLLKLSCS